MVVLRHTSRFEEALDACNQQYQLAQRAESGLDADVEKCRAIGNAGMCAYNMATRLSDDKDDKVKLLAKAEEQLLERISRAQALQDSLELNPSSKWVAMSRAWETIGMDRLSLVYIEQGRFPESLEIARLSQKSQHRIDPTVTAYSKFFYGNTLWYNGQRDAACKQWSAEPGVCSSPVAFCKELSKEHNGYLRRMAEAGINFDSYDEQGFSALDYVALSESSEALEAAEIVVMALEDVFGKKVMMEHPDYNEHQRLILVQDMISARKRQAEVRRVYRNLFQESIRPKLQAVQDSNTRHSTIQQLRTIYKNFSASTDDSHQILWPFRYIRYEQFKNNGKLPIYGGSSSGRVVRDVRDVADVTNIKSNQRPGVKDPFVIFISYRWCGGRIPDDSSNTQWRRMVEAVEQYLEINPHLNVEDIAIWLVFPKFD